MHHVWSAYDYFQKKNCVNEMTCLTNINNSNNNNNNKNDININKW